MLSAAARPSFLTGVDDAPINFYRRRRISNAGGVRRRNAGSNIYSCNTNQTANIYILNELA